MTRIAVTLAALWSCLSVNVRGQTVPSFSQQYGQEYSNLVRAHSIKQNLIKLGSFDYPLNSTRELTMGIEILLSPVGLMQIPRDAVANRSMLHLLICNNHDYNRGFVYPSSFTTTNGFSANSTIPRFCLNGEYMRGKLCDYVPLPSIENLQDDQLYVVQHEFKRNIVAMDGVIHLILVNCESLGGTEALLRSCANAGGQDTSSSQCFSCSRKIPEGILVNQTGCSETIAPRAPVVLHYNIGFTICSESDFCLTSAQHLVPLAYLGLSLVWTSALGLWCWSIFIAHKSDEAVVELQKNMTWVPLTKLITMAANYLWWASRASAASATSLSYFGLIVAGATGVEHMQSANVLMYIAFGWKITRAELHPHENRYILTRSIAWGFLWVHVLLVMQQGNSSAQSRISALLVFLWIFMWISILHTIWSQSAKNQSMLEHQLHLIQTRTRIVGRSTPVHTKYVLFGRFREAYGGYLFASVALQLILASGYSAKEYQVMRLVAMEALDFVLYFAIGYTFRCRKFRTHLNFVTYRSTPDAVEPSAMSSVNTERRQWTEAMQLPTLSPTEVAHGPASPKVVVIMNPDDNALIGTQNLNHQSTEATLHPKKATENN